MKLIPLEQEDDSKYADHGLTIYCCQAGRVLWHFPSLSSGVPQTIESELASLNFYLLTTRFKCFLPCFTGESLPNAFFTDQFTFPSFLAEVFNIARVL